jgi:hypothetical protein
MGIQPNFEIERLILVVGLSWALFFSVCLVVHITEDETAGVEVVEKAHARVLILLV